jgi:hypothetical protein
MNVPHSRQFQPILPLAGSNGVARGPLRPDCGGGFGKLGAAFPGPKRLCWGIGCGGCSRPQASQVKKSRGLCKVHCGHAHLLGSVETVICCGEAGGGVGGSCLVLSCSSSSLIRRGGPHDAVREVGNGREVTKLGCGPVTRRDSGRPGVSITGSDDWRPRGGREADDADDISSSLGQSKPDNELGAGEAVRDGGLLNDRPFSRSQLSPPSPVGRPNLCISSSYMRSCKALAMAISFASSCSAVVRNPSCSCWWPSLPASTLLLAHPSVMLFLLDAASAMTLRISTPRVVDVPPKR